MLADLEHAAREALHLRVERGVERSVEHGGTRSTRPGERFTSVGSFPGANSASSALAGWRVIENAMFAAAEELDVPLRWGGDWDIGGDESDGRFRDWVHFELPASAYPA